MRAPVTAQIAYVRDTGERPRYYANAHEKDTIVVDLRPMEIVDLRGQETSLDVEGCVLVEHRSQVPDFTNPEVVGALHGAVLREQLLEVRAVGVIAQVPDVNLAAHGVFLS